MKLYKNLIGISGHTKSTDLIIDIIKRIKISGETVPLRVAFSHSNFPFSLPFGHGWLKFDDIKHLHLLENNRGTLGKTVLGLH
jgi:hypothetical protein